MKRKEETLDPENWDTVRKLGHEMIDDIIDYFKTSRTAPMYEPIPEKILEKLHTKVPTKPEGPEHTYQQLKEILQHNSRFNTHPKFWGFVVGTGDIIGAYADLWASTINHSVENAYQLPYHIELQALEWMKQMLNYPQDSSGIFVSGGTAANLTGLVVARNQIPSFDVRENGLQGTNNQLTVYGSIEMHSCHQKNCELIGIGNKNLRKIPVNEEFQIRLDLLEEKIREDREKGYLPICVIGNAGSVNTAAFDDLEALASFCEKEGLWFHIDGAFGAWAELCPELRYLVKGMNMADSIAFDLHKWMYMPYGIGCTLVKNKKAHFDSFTLQPDYLAYDELTPDWLSDYGVELSRDFKALKAWMSLKTYGSEKYGRLIQQNVDQAKYLVKLVEESSVLELMAPVPLNVVCFRYYSGSLSEDQLAVVNDRLVYELMFGGCYAATTKVNGVTCLRAAVTNHRSRREDFDYMIEILERKGVEIEKEITGK